MIDQRHIKIDGDAYCFDKPFFSIISVDPDILVTHPSDYILFINLAVKPATRSYEKMYACFIMPAIGLCDLPSFEQQVTGTVSCSYGMVL